MKLTISLAQMDVKLGDPAANLATVQRLSAEAAATSADLLVLPELWSTGYDLTNAERHATAETDGIFAQVSGLARTHQLAIVGSCLATDDLGRVTNTATFHDRDGSLLASYSKLHLFRLMDEDQYLAPGDTLGLVDSAWGQIGLAICYDLRFPELFRALALAGVSAVILPAEWPYPRLSHWRTLLRARAIENQLYMIACNRVGISAETSFFGHSCIIDPWGENVVEGDDAPALLTATIDLAEVSAVRSRIPVFDDRRPNLYARWTTP